MASRNASFLIKEKTKLIHNSINIDQSVNDDYSNYGIGLDALDQNSISQNQYSDESYWTRLSVNAVAQNLRLAFDGDVVTSVRYGDDDVDFRVQLAKKSLNDLECDIPYETSNISFGNCV